ncbi:hypothetical protein EVAR_102454_1 [Eumeta japonica]|uniref:Uncharacterized protein n=1 Tax=Eumeta variegata TaxID=151549 RepID=A0A4C1ZTL7_EUMVA|nr:hypothetical protein EVAR_102454_1 [Eumeta japonica]
MSRRVCASGTSFRFRRTRYLFHSGKAFGDFTVPRRIVPATLQARRPDHLFARTTAETCVVRCRLLGEGGAPVSSSARSFPAIPARSNPKRTALPSATISEMSRLASWARG